MDRLRTLKLFMMVLFVENSEEQRPYVEQKWCYKLQGK